MMSSDNLYWDCYYQRQQATASSVPGTKIRSSANEKERGRVQTVNTAFNHLRTMIPTDPKDRKLSKVETLRLAASYISHLSAVLLVGSSENQPCSRHRHAQNRTVCTFCLSGLKHRSRRHTSADQRPLTEPNDYRNHTNASHHGYHYGNRAYETDDDWLTYSSNQAVAQWLAVQETEMNDDVTLRHVNTGDVFINE